MVTSLLQGGLGNYMFQIAAAQALALDVGTEAVFDFNRASQVHRNIRGYQDNILSEVKDVKNPRFGHKYNEPNFGYNTLPKIDNQLLIGYFQSEKYFEHHRDEIVRLFLSPTPESYKLLDDFIYKNLDAPIKEYCAIHVRRGDYVKLAAHHPPLTMDYYREAIAKIKAKKFLVFSDDMVWCKENFVGDQYTFVEGNPDYIDLYLIAYCHKIIIANSSFSWWAAWLGEAETVVSPQHWRWFGPAKGDIITTDIIPEGWLLTH